MNRRTARLLSVLALAAVALPPLLLAPATAAPTAPSAGRDGFRATKTLTRELVNADGSIYRFPSHRVTVTVDHTQNLRGRQRVRVSWTGAQPSGGRASNPYGENGLLQEYPVVILQCRGRDDDSLPAAKRLRPETCWTGSVAQRSQVTRSPGEAAWVHDVDATAEQRARLSGMAPFPSSATCPTADIDPYFTHLTPFVTAKGKTFAACDSPNMPPEAAVGAAFPPAELAAFTDLDGKGSVQFEVRSEVENESLGCSHDVACSIVVIPIVGLSCDQPSSPMTLSDQACRKGGRFAPGSSNFTNDGVDQAVSPALWWSPSNWKNRISVPITFGLPPDTCDVLDQRAPTGFYGSELLAQAALQWTPAYCLRKDRFKFQLNQMSDEAGWNLMTSGEGAAAEVSSEHTAGTDPVGYAPTSVTGFAVGYVIDRPDNQGELTRLRLTPRLVVKLLTQSYLGSDLGRGHPGLEGNPLGIMSDPEFVKLNPGLTRVTQEAGASLLSLSNSSDIMQQLTDWIAHDKDAVAFVAGRPDPWGMKVNPAYEDIALPTAEWPLLDSYVPETENACRKANPAVYFTQLAAPVTTLRKISDALLDAWPNVQTRCDFDLSTQQYKLGRIDRQSYGSRFMLGLVSLGDAARYGLRTAALQTEPHTFVAPSRRSLAAAVALTTQGDRLSPYVLDQADVRRSGRAYPGTMVVYTAARLANLPKPQADKVAQFIRVSTTEGQRPGSGNGQLPEGYLPITRQGPTGKLFDQAQRAADAVERQKVPTPGSGSGPGGAGGGGGSGSAPGGGKPPAEAGSDAGPQAGDTTRAQVQDMPATMPVYSKVANGLLPAVLLLGVVALVVGAGARFLAGRGEDLP